MKVTRLKIQNYKGIANAELLFNDHTLLVGSNNVGKSTICEALDLVLGPDRLNKYPPIDEYDFYNAKYIDDDNNPILMSVEVVLTDLSGEVRRLCGNHLEFWHKEEKRLLEQGELELVDQFGEQCLRLTTIGKYSSEEDEFEAKVYYTHSPDADEGKLTPVRKSVKRTFGFLYLRTLRTGTRAMSLERGSLLDIILKLKEVRTGMWEDTRERLYSLKPAIEEASEDLQPILNEIETRLGEYISIQGDEKTTRFHVSNLTREHLRKTLSFFLATNPDQAPVPFQRVGTGTLNILVLALLSFVADLKKDNVIFAMEEPEIALSPHTQRRVANYLLTKTTQCFVTTHSPYVIEYFEPEHITILKRDEKASITGTNVTLSAGLKSKTYHKNVRKGLAEAILSQGVIVAEGITEVNVLQSVAQKMEEHNKEIMPLDLSGVTIITSDGDGNIWEFGAFLKSLNIPVYAFLDKKQRNEEEKRRLAESFDVVNETDFTGMEELLVQEISLDHQWTFLEEQKYLDSEGKLGIPSDRPDDNTLKGHAKKVLKAGKGDGRASLLINLCAYEELPNSVKIFLATIYKIFTPKPRDESEAETAETVVEESSAAEDQK